MSLFGRKAAEPLAAPPANVEAPTKTCPFNPSPPQGVVQNAHGDAVAAAKEQDTPPAKAACRT